MSVVVLLSGSRSWALEISNLELVSRAAAQAVDDAVTGLDLAGSEDLHTVDIVPAAEHDANWLFDHLLAEELLRRGLSVSLEAEDPAATLSYRVVEIVVSGRSALLSNSVLRRCRVGVQLDFRRGDEHLWTGEGRAQLDDWIPKGELEALQHTRFDFASTELEKRTWGKYVEPVIVSAVLGSLVYLFFSNR
jgi:hypothetical protein